MVLDLSIVAFAVLLIILGFRGTYPNILASLGIQLPASATGQPGTVIVQPGQTVPTTGGGTTTTAGATLPAGSIVVPGHIGPGGIITGGITAPVQTGPDAQAGSIYPVFHCDSNGQNCSRYLCDSTGRNCVVG